MERGALWRQVVELKYNSIGGGWCTKAVTGPHGISLWIDI